MDRKVNIADIIQATSVTDETCLRRLARINGILDMFFWDLIETNATRVGECFTGSGEIVINSTYPILKVHGFYGKGSGDCFYDLDNECGCGRCSTCLTKGIKLTQSEYYLDKFQWRKDGPNQLTVQLGCSVKDGYYVYSRGAEHVTSLTQKIGLNSDLEVGLRMLMEMFYAQVGKQFQAAAYRKTEYKEWLATVRQNNDSIPTHVGRGYLPTT